MRLSRNIGSTSLLVVLLFCLVGMGFTQESSVQITQENYDRLMTIFKALESKYSLQESLLASSKITISNLQKSISDGQNEISALKNLRDQLQKAIDEKTNLIIGLQKELAESKVDSNLLNQTLANWETMLTDLVARWEEVSTLYSKASKSFQEYKEAAERKIQNLEIQRNILFGAVIAEALGLGIMWYFR